MSSLRFGPHLATALLGRGATGAVWATEDGAALKVLTEPPSPESRAALLWEVRALGALDHPNLVTLLDRGTVGRPDAESSGGKLQPGQPWMLMERAHHGSLVGWPRHDWPDLEPVAHALLDALAHVHARGLLHLDLKPGNVLRHHGEVWLSDLGIAAALGAGGGAVGGSLSTMSPEQLEARGAELGPWTDLYGLGATLLGLLLGERPWPTGSIEAALEARLRDDVEERALDAGAPEEIARWLAALLEEDARRRPPTAAHARALLRGGGAGRALPARPSTTTWTRPRPSPGPGVFGLRTTRLVGRHDAQDALWDALREVASERRPVLVQLVGEAGSGRSRVLRWLAEAAHLAGLPRAWQASSADGAVHEDPLLGAARQAMGWSSLSPGARLQRCRELDPERAWELADLLDGDSVFSVGETTARLLHLARVISAEGPLVICLDDADPDELPPLVGRLLAAAEPAAVLVVVASAVDGSTLSHARRVALDPLDASSARALVADLLSVEGTVADALVVQVGRSPGALVETLGAAVRQGVLRPGLGGTLPPVPQARLVLGRQEWAALGLRGTVRTAARCLAVLSGRVRLDELRRATAGLQPGPDGLPAYLEALEALSSAGLVQVDSECLTWRQRAVRHAVIEGLLDAGQAVHLACLGAVEEAGRKAHHALGAGRPALARDLLVDAIEHAFSRGRSSGLSVLLDDLEAALDELGHDPSHPERLLARAQRVRLLRLHGRLDEAMVQARQLAAETGPEHAPLAGGLTRTSMAAIAERAGDYVETLALNEEAARCFEAAGEVGRATSLRLCSLGLRAELGQREAALAGIEELGVVDLIDQAGPEVCRELLGVGMGPLLHLVPEAGRRFGERCVAIFEAQGERFLQAMSHMNLAELAHREPDLERARHHAATATRLLDELGYDDAAIARMNEGMLAVELGRKEEARKLLNRALDTLVRVGHLPGCACAAAWLAAVALDLGDEPALAAALGQLERLSQDLHQGEPDTLRGLAHALALPAAATNPDARRSLAALLEQWSPP